MMWSSSHQKDYSGSVEGVGRSYCIRRDYYGGESLLPTMGSVHLVISNPSVHRSSGELAR